MLKTIRIAVSPVMDMPGDFTQGVDFLKNVGMVWLDLSGWFGWNGWEVVSKKLVYLCIILLTSAFNLLTVFTVNIAFCKRAIKLSLSSLA